MISNVQIVLTMIIIAWSSEGVEAVETESHVNRLFIDVISFDIFVASACMENQKFGMDSAAELGFFVVQCVRHELICVSGLTANF